MARVVLAGLLAVAPASALLASSSSTRVASTLRCSPSMSSTTPLRQAAAGALKTARPFIRGKGWFFTYADLRPYTESTLAGQAFLATNIAIVAAGAAISAVNPGLGTWTELAGTASIGYHYAQVSLGGTQRPLVQLAMLVDYFFAIPATVAGVSLAVSLGDALPAGAVVCGALAGAGLVAGWIWDGPREYLVLHGAWHVFGGLAGIQIADALAAT